jgi:hypothetical protein
MMRKLNYVQQLQRIVNKYIEAGEEWPATSHQIAKFAIDNHLWEAQKATVIDLCAEQLARAMREEYIHDPQGRVVRAKHAARVLGQQTVLWADIRTASREHMVIALQQRRQQIVGDCRQLKADTDSYNENYNTGKQIAMIFDFTDDIAELETLEVGV